MSAKKETWLDWVAPVPEEEARIRAEPMLKTDQLLAALASRGIKANRFHLSYWQSVGVLPYPTRRRLGKAAWAFYPAWTVDLVVMLRSWQADGLDLKTIALGIRECTVKLCANRADAASETVTKIQQLRRSIVELQTQLAGRERGIG